MIDPLTAIIALLGTALAIYLWSWTRKYILTTRADITAQIVLRVTNAVTALKAETHTILDPLTIEMQKLKTALEASKPDLAPLHANIDTKLQGFSTELDHKLQDLKASMTEIAVDVDLDGLAKQLYAHFKSDEGVMTKKLQGELEKMGPAIRGMENALIEEAQGAKSAVDIATMRFLNMDVSDDFRELYPDYAAYLDQSKIAWAQLVQLYRQMGKPVINALQTQGTNSDVVAGSTVKGAGSWNPGLRRG